MKNYVKDFMDKAVKKKEEREKARAARGEAAHASPDTPQPDVDDTPGAAASPNDFSAELKRKREDDTDESPRNLRSRADEPPAPPPPPPPPAGDIPMDLEEAGLTPMDDGSIVSFTESAPSNVKLPLRASDQASPMQLVTPPSNGSGESKGTGSTD